MASVRIDKGPITATTELDEIPREQWITLVRERRDFLKIRLQYDCRCLLEWLEEAEKREVWRVAGFQSLEDMIRRGWELEPELVEWALVGLRSLKPEDAVPFERAVEVGRRGRGGQPGNQNAAGVKTNHDNIIIRSESQGTSVSYLKDRLRRNHPGIFAKLETYPSVRAAALEAGIVKPTFTIPADPSGAARAIKRKFIGERFDSFVKALVEG